MKAFNIFNALGSIAFAYNFTGVLMEIQVGASCLVGVALFWTHWNYEAGAVSQGWWAHA